MSVICLNKCVKTSHNSSVFFIGELKREIEFYEITSKQG